MAVVNSISAPLPFVCSSALFDFCLGNNCRHLGAIFSKVEQDQIENEMKGPRYQGQDVITGGLVDLNAINSIGWTDQSRPANYNSYSNWVSTRSQHPNRSRDCPC